MQNKGKLTIMKYFRACVGSFLVYIYTYGTVNSIFVEIQPDSTNIKNDPHIKAIQLYEMFIFCTYSLVLNMIFGVKSMIVRTIWDNISCYRFYLPDYLPWILTTLATYLLKSVASITQKSIRTFK